MPRIVQNASQRALERVFAAPANQAHATARQQQGAISGQIPGTTSPYNQTGVAYGLIQPGATGDQVAGVGHAVLANDGSPVVVMGNMKVTGASGHPPAGFQDGGFAFTDASGNAIAGYSHPTGLWGFGTGAILGNGFRDFVQSDNWTTLTANGTQNSCPLDIASPPSWITAGSPGNFHSPGVYAQGIFINGNARPTTSGLFATVQLSAFGAYHISLDALWQSSVTGPNYPGVAPEETLVLAARDVDFSAGGTIWMPTDATATIDIRCWAWRIAY